MYRFMEIVLKVNFLRLLVIVVIFGLKKFRIL